MSTDWIELLLHPVRIRIITALRAQPVLTTAQLAERMSDVAQATLYRQVATLLEAGVIEVEGEDRTRGPAERRYRLRPEGAKITPDAAAAMTIDDHRRAFTAAMGSLIGEFNWYLDQPGANPRRDRVSYRYMVLWLTEREMEQFQGRVQEALFELMRRPAPRSSRPYLVTPICFPTAGSGGQEVRRVAGRKPAARRSGRKRGPTRLEAHRPLIE